MNHKTAWVWISFLGMTMPLHSIAAQSSETPPQIRQAAQQQLARPDGARGFSDLYSVTWEEIPMPENTPADPHDITAHSITNDGTIAGKGTGALVFWHPDMQAWEWVPKQFDTGDVFISPDGLSVVATDAWQWPEPTDILTWRRAVGWQAMAGSTVAQSLAYNVSRNFRFVVGTGNNNGEAGQAWVWDIGGGVQQMLPNPDWSESAGAAAVSDDGNVVVGHAIRRPQPGQIWSDILPVRWIGGGPPTMLRAPDGRELSKIVACSADCSIVFGGNGWFLKDNGEFGFLFWSMGTPPDAYPDPYAAYSVGDASSDGSLVVGLYSANMYPGNPNSESYVKRPFVWTRETGITSLRAPGIGDDDWRLFARMRMSPDGRRILISGIRRSGQSRAVVLHLTPRVVTPGAGHSTRARPIPPPTPRRVDQNGSLQAGSRAIAD